VRVDHHVRVPRGKQFIEGLRSQRVALGKVAVQVEVAAVAAKAELLGAILVHARRIGAVDAAVDVVQGDEQEHGVFQTSEALRLVAKVAHQRHAGIDAFRFARVDAVIVEEDRALRCLDGGQVELAVGADHAGVDRQAGVGHADDGKAQHMRKALGQILVPGDAFVPGGGLVLVTRLERRVQ
jgi:hypothetical protein